ncbi:MAG: hypothetical protein QM708_12030 [Propioniciclava sp.]|uniref:hypothetical protein n=1 Tax=Propioniciclava sp. TaxID=2038686 RepID=UPI0039E6039A
MVDYAASGLKQTMRFERLTRDRKTLDALTGVASFSRERNQHASPSTGATISIDQQAPDDWRRGAIRALAQSSFAGKTEIVPVFTGIPVLTGDRRASRQSKVTLRLLDYTTLLDRPLGRPVYLQAGGSYTALVRQLYSTAGATGHAITDSAAVSASGARWPATKTIRQVCTEIARAIGYRATWADELGALHFEPYIAPGHRPVDPDLGFVHGHTCTYRPDVDVDVDFSDTPNMSLVTARSPWDRVEGVAATAFLPDRHPLSVASRDGYVVPLVEEDVDLGVEITPGSTWDDPDDVTIDWWRGYIQPFADAYAARILEQKSAIALSYTVENRFRPFALMSATRLLVPATDAAPEIDTTVTISKDTLEYQAGAVPTMTTTLTEVQA